MAQPERAKQGPQPVSPFRSLHRGGERFVEIDADWWGRVATIMVALAASIYVLGWLWQLGREMGDVLLLFLLSWLLSYVLMPAADWLAHHHVPRAWAVGITYTGLAAVLAVFLWLVLPATLGQLAQLAGSLPFYASEMQGHLNWLQGELNVRGFNDVHVTTLAQHVAADIEVWTTRLLQNSLNVLGNLATIVLRTVLVLILSFYMTLDGRVVLSRLSRLVPPRLQGEAQLLGETIDQTFGGYLRGTLLQMVIYGTGTGLVVTVAHLGFALPLAIFAGCALIVPFIGPVVAVVPPLVICVLQRPERVWWMFLLLILLQQAVINVLAPRIFSKSLGVHPLVVFTAMLLGVKVGGVWGAVFGIPVAGVAYFAARRFLDQVLARTSLYRPLADARAAGEPRAVGEARSGADAAPTPRP